ncbi:hypothetical protein B0H19DRAFT_1079020 [Mycena capillaripes]|nr:hypothetical protein B0H19DRAFT_1079020 [Mycena capillaripes]
MHSVWRGCATKHAAQLRGCSAEVAPYCFRKPALAQLRRRTAKYAVSQSVRLDALIPFDDDSAGSGVARVLRKWRAYAQSLTKWLDWGVWLKCRPACEFQRLFRPTAADGDEKNTGVKETLPKCLSKAWVDIREVATCRNVVGDRLCRPPLIPLTAEGGTGRHVVMPRV